MEKKLYRVWTNLVRLRRLYQYDTDELDREERAELAQLQDAYTAKPETVHQDDWLAVPGADTGTDWRDDSHRIRQLVERPTRQAACDGVDDAMKFARSTQGVEIPLIDCPSWRGDGMCEANLGENCRICAAVF